MLIMITMSKEILLCFSYMVVGDPCVREYAALLCKYWCADLSVSEKVAILHRIHCQPKGTSHRQLTEMLNVPKTTIGRLLKQEAKLCTEFWEKGKGHLS